MQIEGRFYVGARMAPCPSGVAAPQGAELNLIANSTETTGKGYTASVIPRRPAALPAEQRMSQVGDVPLGQLGG